MTATATAIAFNTTMVRFMARALVAHVKAGGSFTPDSMKLVAGWNTRSREEREAAMEAACAEFLRETHKGLHEIAYFNSFKGAVWQVEDVVGMIGAEYTGGYMYSGFKGWLDYPDGTTVRVTTALHWVRQHGREEDTEEGREQVRTAPVGTVFRMRSSGANRLLEVEWERVPEGYVCLDWYEEKN